MDFETSCENCIEFLRNEKTATVTFSQRKYITKIKRLAEKYPDEVEICAENEDGSIVAHIPVKYVRISPPKKLTEEQKESLRERLAKVRKADSNKDNLE